MSPWAAVSGTLAVAASSPPAAPPGELEEDLPRFPKRLMDLDGDMGGELRGGEEEGAGEEGREEGGGGRGGGAEEEEEEEEEEEDEEAEEEEEEGEAGKAACPSA